MRVCHRCGKEVALEGKIGRSETCSSCGADLHVCLNCLFYSPGAYNDCRESQAERVVEKGRRNFCDFFRFAEGRSREASRKETSRSRLDDLFKK